MGMANVTLLGDDLRSVSFPCTSRATIAAAARDAGYRLHTVCERGGCGACRATLVSGSVANLGGVSASKTRDPATGGRYELLCRATPLTDVVVHPLRAWGRLERHPLSSLLIRR